MVITHRWSFRSEVDFHVGSFENVTKVRLSELFFYRVCTGCFHFTAIWGFTFGLLKKSG